MLEDRYRNQLMAMAKATNIVLPDLDMPANRQARLIIYSVIRIHDELLISRHLKPVIEDVQSEAFVVELHQLNRERQDLVDLTVKVFTHLNDLNPP